MSCIDCNVVFDFRTVRSHSCCITEAEKQGPKKNRGTEDCEKISAGLKWTMKKVLKDASKRKREMKAFVRAIAELIDEKTPSDLAVNVEKKISKSRRFILYKDRISVFAMEAGTL